VKSNRPHIDIIPLPAFSDNYIWIIRYENKAIAIDPGDANPVLSYIAEHHITLTHIFITHHHPDHTGGVRSLVEQTGAMVYAPNTARFSYADEQLNDDDSIDPGKDLIFKIINCPGHTIDHIAYYSPELNILFCGDTLFSAGCGRIFDGSASMLYHSLQRFAQLPGETKVYCTHEYTLANIAFAEHVEPNNDALIQYKKWCIAQRQQSRPTLPTTIEQEQAINPFMRVRDSAQIPAEQQFIELRKAKDRF
jgi:hydroxyacylglutathione hydrolase